MTKWDYDRVGSLLQQVSDQAAAIAADLDSSTPEKFDLSAMLQRVEQVDRDVNTTKTLLKRERLRRA